MLQHKIFQYVGLVLVVTIRAVSCFSATIDGSALVAVSSENLPPIPEDITVGCFYYPWHGDDFHRDGGYLREVLDPPHQPTLGEYDDSQPGVVHQHLIWSRQANINLWIASWWGPNSREDSTIKNVILPHTYLRDHKVTLLYESLMITRDEPDYDIEKAGRHMSYICTEYFDHPNYFRINDRPVIFVYLTRLLYSLKILEDVIMQIRSNCHHDVYIVGDHIWGNAPSPSNDYPPFDLLDALTNYDVYGNMGAKLYAGQDAVDNYYDQQELWRQRSIEFGVGYIPAVSPGYNDRGVRLDRDHEGLSRRLTPDSEPGSLFVAELLRARYLVDPAVQNLIVVNSFNEWHEDSQIEPAVGRPTTLPVEYTNGIEYIGYGELYLDILRAATTYAKYEKLEKVHALFETSSSAPNNILVGALYYALNGRVAFHDNGGYLRAKLDSTQTPLLGEYSELESQVVAQHLEWSRQANIGLWVASWDGFGTPTDTIIRNSILPHGDLQDHKIALLYETTKRISQRDGWDVSNIEHDIDYICNEYFDHPNYLHIHGKPVLVLRLSRVLYQGGVLDSIIVSMRSIANGYGYGLYVIGDQVVSSAPNDDVYLPFLTLDAVTNLDIYGDFASKGYAGENTVDDYYDRQFQWRKKAWESNCGYVPSVTPGWNNRGSNLIKDREPLARQLSSTSPEGSLFATSLERARYLVDSETHNLLLVNSFNRWEEDTQIEPVVGDATNKPHEITQGYIYDGYGNLYLDILMEKTTDITPSKSNNNMISFYELNCNKYTDFSKVECLSWSFLFGEQDQHEKEVTIPCGKCIIMDHKGSDLELAGGLNVHGKLIFPEEFNLSISTPYVLVQGELQIYATQEVTGEPSIRFVLMQSEPGTQKFIPADVNANACGTQRCDPGPNSITIAGGKVEIHGLPANTPTWLPLIDVITTDDPPPMVVPMSCRTDGVYIKEEFFDDGPSSSFSSTPGSAEEFIDGSMKVFDRTSTFHGVQVDLRDINECLQADEFYNLKVLIRLHSKDEIGKPTECSQSGQGCLTINVDTMDSSEQVTSMLKFEETMNSRWMYGEWVPISLEISFSDVEIDPSNIYNIIRISGVAESIDIELSEFSLVLQPKYLCLTERVDCGNLFACNGNAEFGFELSNFIQQDNIDIQNIQEDDGNRYWKINRIQPGSAATDGLQIKVANECMKENAVYRFQTRIRVHPDEQNPGPIETSVYIRAYRKSKADTQRRIVNCAPSSGEWVNCESYFVIPPRLETTSDYVAVFFETVGSNTVTYDVDDLMFQYVHMESPVTGLILDKSIDDKWGVGSEILITSHSTEWDGESVRIIKNLTPRDDGTTVVELDQQIVRPITSSYNNLKSIHGVEVALLSRNVLFQGIHDNTARLGGQMVVYYTPTIEQVIDGVEFRNFGNAGILGGYPIHFQHSRDVIGSIISRNTIRDSYQRCIVLSGTNNVLIEQNVAFNTAGHCFVLQDGMETGNIFRHNLGAQTRSALSILMNGDTHEESDDLPATFFAINPNNKWEGNVGAGSEGSGFEILLNSMVRGMHADKYLDMMIPKNVKLDVFKNNIAHSNQVNGVRIASLNDYHPHKYGMELEGIIAFRNKGTGILLSQSHGISIIGANLADNRRSIHAHESDSMTIKDTTIVGRSTEFQIFESTQASVQAQCAVNADKLTAIEIQSFSRIQSGDGLTMEHTNILGFDGLKCTTTVLEITPKIGWGASDYLTSTMGITLEEHVPFLSLCKSIDNNIVDVYLTDRDSSLLNSTIATTYTTAKSATTATATTVPRSLSSPSSSIISTGSQALTFLSNNHCIEATKHCYYYCQGICLRTVRFAIDPADPQDYTLQICQKGTISGVCETYTSISYTNDVTMMNDNDNYYNFLYDDLWGNEEMNEKIISSRLFVIPSAKYFYVTLPRGRYEATFINEYDQIVWPTFVKETYLDPSCDKRDTLVPNSIWIKEPPISFGSHYLYNEPKCNDLIRNGNAEHYEGHPYWISGHGGPNGSLVRSPLIGMDGSFALCDDSAGVVTSSAAASVKYFTMGQYLDTQCLIQNRIYQIGLWIRLQDVKTGMIHSLDHCGPFDSDKFSCPLIGLNIVDPDGTSWTIEVKQSLANIFFYDPNISNDSSFQDDYNLMELDIQITAEIAHAASVFLFIDQNKSSSSKDDNIQLCIDNVSMRMRS